MSNFSAKRCRCAAMRPSLSRSSLAIWLSVNPVAKRRRELFPRADSSVRCFDHLSSIELVDVSQRYVRLVLTICARRRRLRPNRPNSCDNCPNCKDSSIHLKASCGGRGEESAVHLSRRRDSGPIRATSGCFPSRRKACNRGPLWSWFYMDAVKTRPPTIWALAGPRSRNTTVSRYCCPSNNRQTTPTDASTGSIRKTANVEAGKPLQSDR